MLTQRGERSGSSLTLPSYWSILEYSPFVDKFPHGLVEAVIKNGNRIKSSGFRGEKSAYVNFVLIS